MNDNTWLLFLFVLLTLYIIMVQVQVAILQEGVARNKRDLELICEHLNVEVWHQGYDKPNTRYLRPKNGTP